MTAPINTPFLREELDRFLKEDLGRCELFGDDRGGKRIGVIRAKAPGIVCGSVFMEELFGLLSGRGDRVGVEVETFIREGRSFKAGDPLLNIKARAEVIIGGARTALNLMQLCCGIATNTADLVRRVKPHGTTLLDTRKTTPGFRAFEKYAVLTGGGKNHRHNREDGVMLKKEDIAIIGEGSPVKAIKAVAARTAHLTAIEVEVENLADLHAVLLYGDQERFRTVRYVLLDNMSPDDVYAAVQMAGDKVALEASGVTIGNLEDYAKTGVPFISTSALIRGADAVDLHLVITK